MNINEQTKDSLATIGGLGLIIVFTVIIGFIIYYALANSKAIYINTENGMPVWDDIPMPAESTKRSSKLYYNSDIWFEAPKNN